ncbi:MAG: PD-(D/E)XK nuclease family protein, partial [Planctomycetales bacterium]|nr:PD-(D/E)XK nuclease family protein [Planctomycetales bacterium]
MPGITRVFLDWNRPALGLAADWLLAHADGLHDLSGVVAVLPGSRAGRRLLEILLQKSAGAGGLAAPKIVTMGALPELLYTPQRQFADDLTQRLAWVEALRAIPPEELQPYIPALPAAHETPRLLEIADMLRGQHIELAADGLDFDHVAQTTARLGEQRESQRWRALRKVQRTYLDVLDRLELWDRQTARLIAIEKEECQTAKRIVLIGAVDINRAGRQMLDQVADHVTALIFAPPDRHGHFDAHGCLEPDAWRLTRVPLADDRIALADDPSDQADETARAIAAFDGRYRADEITIGVCDERIVPQIQRQLEACGLPVRWGPGKPLAQTPAFRLLHVIAEFLEQATWRDFAALVRHPDFDAWLGVQPTLEGDWLTQLDKYLARHMQSRYSTWLLGKADEVRRLKPVVEAVDNLCAPFAPRRGQSEKLQPPGEWAQELAKLLPTLYGRLEFDLADPAERAQLKALETLHESIGSLAALPQELGSPISAAEALRWALDAVSGETIAPPADQASLEMVGWLEMALDDAPAAVVTTLNEGHVPKSAMANLFLPDALRTRLGLDDNARRYARDAYALSAVVASRDVRFVVGRRDGDGYPLAPSRLLLACDDAALVRRARQLFSPPKSQQAKPPLVGAQPPLAAESAFAVPRPTPHEPIDELSVTRFRDYIACPYRFYLQHVEKLRTFDDAAGELDGGTFGELAHDVLSAFGADARAASTDVGEIVRLLEELLETLVADRFGKSARPAVAVQVAQLKLRLQAFARAQAAQAQAGWRIQ